MKTMLFRLFIGITFILISFSNHAHCCEIQKERLLQLVNEEFTDLNYYRLAHGRRSTIKYTLVLSKDTRYHFAYYDRYNDYNKGKRLKIKLLNSLNKEVISDSLSSPDSYNSEFYYDCKATGIYYLEAELGEQSCGAIIQSFKHEYDDPYAWQVIINLPERDRELKYNLVEDRFGHLEFNLSYKDKQLKINLPSHLKKEAEIKTYIEYSLTRSLQEGFTVTVKNCHCFANENYLDELLENTYTPLKSIDLGDRCEPLEQQQISLTLEENTSYDFAYYDKNRAKQSDGFMRAKLTDEAGNILVTSRLHDPNEWSNSFSFECTSTGLYYLQFEFGELSCGGLIYGYRKEYLQGNTWEVIVDIPGQKAESSNGSGKFTVKEDSYGRILFQTQFFDQLFKYQSPDIHQATASWLASQIEEELIKKYHKKFNVSVIKLK